jgi:hypothetical protein
MPLAEKKLVRRQSRVALYMVANQSRNYHVINIIKTMLPTITGKGSLVGVNRLISLGRLDLASRRSRPAATISPLLASTYTPTSLASHLHLCGLIQKQPNHRRRGRQGELVGEAERRRMRIRGRPDLDPARCELARQNGTYKLEHGANVAG